MPHSTEPTRDRGELVAVAHKRTELDAGGLKAPGVRAHRGMMYPIGFAMRPREPNGAAFAGNSHQKSGTWKVLVFSLKAGNKPAGTADDPAAPGPYDAIYKNIQGDDRWAFRDAHY